jgi:phage terminase large subunit-like protein
MCAANAVAVSDPAGGRKFTKSKTTGRIDGMVALAMAVAAMGTIEADSVDINAFLSDPLVL